MSAPTGHDEPTTEQVLDIRLRVNGVLRCAPAPARRLLSDFLRHDLALTGTHVGCEHGVCGACTVLVDGRPTRSCLMFGVQADDSEVETVEGLARDGELDPLQEAFWNEHALQCGFCTPGMILSARQLLADHPNPSESEIRHGLEGNLCRCTGYQHIVNAVKSAAKAGGA